jgi:hypothetical protein
MRSSITPLVPPKVIGSPFHDRTWFRTFENLRRSSAKGDSSPQSALLSLLSSCRLAHQEIEEDRYDSLEDFAYQEQAQTVHNQGRSDSYGLDGPPGVAYEEVQSVACVELPSR